MSGLPARPLPREAWLAMGLAVSLLGCAEILGIEETHTAVCGNDVVEAGEECDDGNGSDDDGCSAECVVLPYCGDGRLDAGEQCDEGDSVDGDGCSSECLAEAFLCGSEVDLTPRTVTVRFEIIDINAPEDQLAGVSIKACGSLDSGCSDPLDTTESDAAGYAELSVGAPFSGSFEFSIDGFVTLHKFRNRPITTDATLPVQMVTWGVFSANKENLGTTPDSGLGNITAEIRDCAEAPAGGVHIDSNKRAESSAAAYYDRGNLLPESEQDTTVAGVGRWALLNAPVGLLDITASLNDVPVATGRLRTRPGVISNILLEPAGD